ncbi:MAG: electron transfer flavoprotein subunit alpha/FixB family protein [Euryarchaeota archaeon]|nr:electron transfer flavoprotein subunit alpha/FixB family protein [Euryarchaeota archaeon]
MEIVCVGEIFNGDVSGSTYEALYLGNQIKMENGGKFTLILAGKDPEQFSKKLSIKGLDNLILLSDPSLEIYDNESYSSAISNEIKEISPDVIIVPYTSQGMDLAPSIAHLLGFPIITYCESIKFSGKGWLATRVIYGGKLREEVEVEGNKVLITIRPGDFPPLREEAQTNIIKKNVSISRGRIKPIEIIKPALEDIDITKFDVLVSVGRGIGSKENLEIAEELAKMLNGAVSCSRPIVDMGWLPKTRQVGSSAKTVKPKVYIALGISGATNHINGMKNSNTIISINKDPFAPIFEISNYGIVADINDLLPLLLEELKK